MVLLHLALKPITSSASTSFPQYMKLASHIPTQELKLVSVVVHMSDTNSASDRFLQLDIPWLNTFMNNDLDQGNHYLTVPIVKFNAETDQHATTVWEPSDCSLQPTEIPSSFPVTVYRADGTTRATTSEVSQVDVYLSYTLASLM